LKELGELLISLKIAVVHHLNKAIQLIIPSIYMPTAHVQSWLENGPHQDRLLWHACGDLMAVGIVGLLCMSGIYALPAILS